MEWLSRVSVGWQLTIGAVVMACSLAASAHAVIFKRDSRATILWVGFIWLSPIIGATLYLLLGVNRIKRRATALRGDLPRYAAKTEEGTCEAADLPHFQPDLPTHLARLARVVTRVVERPMLAGNRVEVLVNGDQAFPAMLEAIDNSATSISLASYIFDNDLAGRKFVQFLARAARRGVEVRVLVDDAGARYSFPSILAVLRREGLKVARFMPRFILLRLAALNMRSHRKIMVVDGRLGFTGGMNIRQGNCLHLRPRHPVQDVHFQVEGPVVAQLQEAFVDDWAFCTGENLRGGTWFPPVKRAGAVVARGITDGPDEDFEKLPMTILGGLNAARASIRLATPYFLPDPPMISALNMAALRGVAVEILLPAKSNLPFMQWASTAHWWQMLKWGCRIWLTPPPFDHSKILVVDGHWSFVGSANLDPRSLRLNFEFNLECYDAAFAASLERLLARKRRGAHLTSLAEVDARGFAVRLRDGIARLATPFL